jgi:hypothetical protein
MMLRAVGAWLYAESLVYAVRKLAADAGRATVFPVR